MREEIRENTLKELEAIQSLPAIPTE